MKAGFAVSLSLHLTALAWGVVSLAAPKPLSVPDVEALPIEIVPIESITKSVQGDREAKAENPPAVKPTTRPQTRPEATNVGNTENDRAADANVATKAPPVEETKAPEVVPEPKPEPIKKTPKPAEPPKTDLAMLIEKNKPEEQKAEEEPKEEFQKLPEKVAVPKIRPRPQKKVDTRKVKEKAVVNREKANAGGAKSSTKKAGLGTKKAGNAGKLAQSEIDALRGRLETCWNVGDLTGHPDAATMRARVEFDLTQSGDIDGRVKVKVSGTDRRTRATLAVRVRAAVSDCAPYALPIEKYDNWKEVVVNFSLADML